MARRLSGMRAELIGGLVLLMAASSAVTWTGSVVISRRAFDKLVEQNDLQAARIVATALGNWYAASGSWQGVAQEIRRLKQSGNYEYDIDAGLGVDTGHPKIPDMPMILTDRNGGLVYNPREETFIRPLVGLERAVQSITAGDLDSRVPQRGSREVVSLAESFNAMADRLRATEHARQNLIADVAHELRTPVSVLQANLEMMIEGVYAADGDRLASLYEETRLLSKLIGDLRTISDLELGMVPIQNEVLPLRHLLRECAESVQPLYLGRGVTLALDLHAPDFRVVGDLYRLRQVLRNVLDNALVHAAGCTEVHITTGRIPPEGGDGRIRAAVSDDGPGVPEADRGRIFERFYRADPSRSRATGGRGLGLAICRELVAACGGTMGAEARLPHGLTVWFELPEVAESMD